MRVLVTGGAGYIGSHVALDLSRNGHEPIILDNLSKGHREAALSHRFIEGDIGDGEHLCTLLNEEKIDAVVHLAADSLVGESVVEPAKYFKNNIKNGLALLDAMRVTGVNRLVFSSTAAVYGEPNDVPIREDHPKDPTNPYGFSKITFEGMMASYRKAYGLNYITLRYFNAAGADSEAGIGEDHRPETHLVPIVLKTALGLRTHIELYGADYPTPDGTCVRDYIHVNDLALAHRLALEALEQGAESTVYNLGNGQGYSNRQVIDTARQVTGRTISVTEGPRRPGDPAVLVASSDKIKAELGWKPNFPDLETIIESAWKWCLKNPRGYELYK